MIDRLTHFRQRQGRLNFCSYVRTNPRSETRLLLISMTELVSLMFRPKVSEKVGQAVRKPLMPHVAYSSFFEDFAA